MSILFVVLPLFCPQKGHVSRRTGRGSIMPCSVSVFVLCSCVRVHACVCMGVRVRACAAQPASSANAPWKTNSVSVDSISRQRSSSDPPAVHPPLPPLRVTSTSTFFSPFSFLAIGLRTTRMAGGEEGGGPLGRHVGSKPRPAHCWGLLHGCLPVAPLLPSGWLLSVPLPTGATPAPPPSPSTPAAFLSLHGGAGASSGCSMLGVLGCVPVDENLLCVSPQCHVCTRGRGSGVQSRIGGWLLDQEARPGHGRRRGSGLSECGSAPRVPRLSLGFHSWS